MRSPWFAPLRALSLRQSGAARPTRLWRGWAATVPVDCFNVPARPALTGSKNFLVAVNAGSPRAW